MDTYRVGTLEFRSHGLYTIIISYTDARRKDYLQARKTKESPVQNESRYLPASIFRAFFLRILFIPGGPIGELCPCADPYIGTYV